jgi:HSP20 family molecular chaperone IbpA
MSFYVNVNHPFGSFGPFAPRRLAPRFVSPFDIFDEDPFFTPPFTVIVRQFDTAADEDRDAKGEEGGADAQANEAHGATTTTTQDNDKAQASDKAPEATVAAASATEEVNAKAAEPDQANTKAKVARTAAAVSSPPSPSECASKVEAKQGDQQSSSTDVAAMTTQSTAVAAPAPQPPPFSLTVTPTESAYSLSYSLPPAAKDSLQLALSPDSTYLTFTFEEKKDADGVKSWRKVERNWGLPDDADVESIEATWVEDEEQKDVAVEVKVGRKNKEEMKKKGRKLISVL